MQKFYIYVIITSEKKRVMEKLDYSQEIKDIVDSKIYGVLDGLFIKRNKGTSYIETLEIIDKNTDKLSLDNYAIFDKFYVDENDRIRAFGGINYDDYLTFKKLYLSSNIDKKKILRDLIKCIWELDSIGIKYTDIHSENIIVNSSSNMRLVDLDEAYPFPTISGIKSLVDIIIESLILYDFNATAMQYVTPRYVIRELSSKNILSKKTLNALNGVESETSFYANVESYIEELSNVEKTSVLRKELINTRPEYF